MRSWVEDIRQQLDTRRQPLRDYEDPVDQLRSKAIRGARRKSEDVQLMVKLREVCKEEEDAARCAE